MVGQAQFTEEGKKILPGVIYGPNSRMAQRKEKPAIECRPQTDQVSEIVGKCSKPSKSKSRLDLNDFKCRSAKEECEEESLQHLGKGIRHIYGGFAEAVTLCFMPKFDTENRACKEDRGTSLFVFDPGGAKVWLWLECPQGQLAKVLAARELLYGSKVVLIQRSQLPDHENTWGNFDAIIPKFHLEDKVALIGAGIDKPLAQFYQRKGKKRRVEVNIRAVHNVGNGLSVGPQQQRQGEDEQEKDNLGAERKETVRGKRSKGAPRDSWQQETGKELLGEEKEEEDVGEYIGEGSNSGGCGEIE